MPLFTILLRPVKRQVEKKRISQLSQMSACDLLLRASIPPRPRSRPASVCICGVPPNILATIGLRLPKNRGKLEKQIPSSRDETRATAIASEITML